MELVIIRHGTAEDLSPEGDRGRNLVEKGRRQARDAGLLLKSSGLLPGIVLASPLNRAKQTAEEFCEAAGIPAPIVVDWMASGMIAPTALSELVAYRDYPRVAIVGHEPDLSEMIQWLLGARGGSVEMRKGTVVCLRVYPPAKLGTILYMAPPSITGD